MRAQRIASAGHHDGHWLGQHTSIGMALAAPGSTWQHIGTTDSSGSTGSARPAAAVPEAEKGASWAASRAPHGHPPKKRISSALQLARQPARRRYVNHSPPVTFNSNKKHDTRSDLSPFLASPRFLGRNTHPQHLIHLLLHLHHHHRPPHAHSHTYAPTHRPPNSRPLLNLPPTPPFPN